MDQVHGQGWGPWLRASTLSRVHHLPRTFVCSPAQNFSELHCLGFLGGFLYMGSIDELGLWPLEVGGGAESSNPLVHSAATSPVLRELLH